MIKEQVLVIGSEKLWDQWVWDQKQEYEFYTYHISRMRLDVLDDRVYKALFSWEY